MEYKIEYYEMEYCEVTLIWNIVSFVVVHI